MKYFLFDHSGCLNRGCEAIARTTCNIIRRADPDASFTLCSFSSSEDSVLSDIERLSVVGYNLKELKGADRLIHSANVRLRKDESHYYKVAYSPVIESAADADICLLIGGDTYCYGDNIGARYIAETLKKKGKKLVLWGASVGSEDLTAEKISNLGLFDGCFLRENISRQNLLESGVDKKTLCFADPAFTLEKEELPLPRGWAEGKMLGFNLSPLVARRNGEISKAAVVLIRHILRETDFGVALLPHVTAPGNNDFEYLTAIKKAVGESDKVLILPDNLTAAQYKGYVARTRLFIGARTHSIIAAYSTCVPALAIGYSVKARGIAELLFGSEKCVVDVKKINSGADFITAFDELCKSENEMRSTLESVIPGIKASAFAAGEELKSL